MDVGAFVQENKRWLAGCAAGGIVWLIAGAVIDSYHDPSGVRLSLKKAGAATQLYDKEVLAAARTENEQLAAELQRLRAELAFVPSAKFQLPAQGAPDQYLAQVGLQLRQSILAEARSRDVEIADKDVRWDVPRVPDEIRDVLFGLELMDEACKRLFAAHDAVRTARPEAMGLRGIASLKLVSRAAQRTARTARPAEVDPRDRVTQVKLDFQFQSDESVLLAFLEACRQPQRTLVIQVWKVEEPARAGAPCTVSGSLQGINFKNEK